MATIPPPTPPQPPSAQLPVPSASAPPAPVRYRRSIFSGLLLILVGALFLLDQLRPGFDLGYAVSHFWPVVIILWGLARLIDHFNYRDTSAHPPLVSGGEIALVVLFAILLGGVALHDWLRNRLPFDLTSFTQRFSQTHHADASGIPLDSRIVVSTRRGDIAISGSDSANLQVTSNESAGGATEDAARERMKNVNVAIDPISGAGFGIHPVNDGGDVSVDLDVQAPKRTSVEAHSENGDVSVSGIAGGTSISAKRGDVRVHDVGADVNVDAQSGDTHVHDASGDVRVTGHSAGDIEIVNVKGEAAVEGEFFGDADFRNVARTVHYSSRSTTISVEHLPGELKVDPGDIELQNASGPVQLSAQNQNVRLSGVDGSLDLTAKRGDVDVIFANPPQAPINITNEAGNITVTLPARSSFTIFAIAKTGTIENNFNWTPQGASDNSQTLNASYGSGGPVIRLVTTYGNIHITKSK